MSRWRNAFVSVTAATRGSDGSGFVWACSAAAIPLIEPIEQSAGTIATAVRPPAGHCEGFWCTQRLEEEEEAVVAAAFDSTVHTFSERN